MKADAADGARRKEWQLYELNEDMMAALEESGGEFTPEVEAIEARIAENADELAELGVNLRAHARSMQDACKTEKQRVDGIRRYAERLEGLAVRWLRVAAAEKGDKFEVGTFRVRLQKAPPRVVTVNEAPSAEEGDRLVALGLAWKELKVVKSAVRKHLKAGFDAPGYMLEYPSEKTVVVR